MQTEIELSVIIPAYNEQDRIVPTLTGTLTYLGCKPFHSQIIVVSDGSSDRTAAVVSRFDAAPHVELKALEYHPNRGKGYAVRYGMRRASGRVLMFMDADYAVPIDYCDHGMAFIRAGYDVAIASRGVPGARIIKQQNPVRKSAAKIFTFLQNRYLGIDFPDTQCGFKLFSKSAAEVLFEQQRLDSVIFDQEVIYLSKKKGLKVAQFPVAWTHVADSRIRYDNLRKSLFVFSELLRIRRMHD